MRTTEYEIAPDDALHDRLTNGRFGVDAASHEALPVRTGGGGGGVQTDGGALALTVFDFVDPSSLIAVMT